MKNKLILILFGTCLFLSGCFTGTSDEQQTDANENPQIVTSVSNNKKMPHPKNNAVTDVIEDPAEDTYNETFQTVAPATGDAKGNPDTYFETSKYFMNLYMEQREKQEVSPAIVKGITENIDKAISIEPRTDFLVARTAYNVLLYKDMGGNYLRQAHEDILAARHKAEKQGNPEQLEMIDAISYKISQLETLLVEMSIYRQAYYSIDKIKAGCGAEALAEYLELAEKTYAILNYQAIEQKLSPENIRQARASASDAFDAERKMLDDNKKLHCAFIGADPYDVLVDGGIKLMNMVEKYAEYTEHKDNYYKFKKTIISYIPKMMINDEQKAEIAEYVKKNFKR